MRMPQSTVRVRHSGWHSARLYYLCWVAVTVLCCTACQDLRRILGPGRERDKLSPQDNGLLLCRILLRRAGTNELTYGSQYWSWEFCDLDQSEHDPSLVVLFSYHIYKRTNWGGGGGGLCLLIALVLVGQTSQDLTACLIDEGKRGLKAISCWYVSPNVL